MGSQHNPHRASQRPAKGLRALSITLFAFFAAGLPPTAVKSEAGLSGFDRARVCGTPRAAVSTLLHWQQPAHYDMQRASACLSLSKSAAPSERADIARQIKEVLDARGLFVQIESVPNQADYTEPSSGISKFILFPSLPSFYVEKVGDLWLWSDNTVAAAPAMYRSTFVVDVQGLSRRLPEPLQRSFLGVAIWQLLGLLILIFVGLVARAVVALFIAAQARAVMTRLGAKWGAEVFSQVDRPLSTVAGAGVVAMLFPLLHLPVRLTQIALVGLRVLAAFSAVWALYRLVDLLCAWMEQKAATTATKLDDQLVPLVRRALKIFVVSVGAIFVLQNLNIDVAGLLAGLGIGGLAFALAAKDTVANLFGSATIFADRPFQIGDWVVVEGAEGIVEQVGFRSTRVRTFYNSLVSIPNSRVANAVVDNYGARQYRRCRTTLAVRYDTTPEQIQAFVEGIRAIIRANPCTRKDYYEIHFNDFGASSLDVMLYFFFKVDSWSEELKQRHNIFLEILRLANHLGVRFAYPTRTLQVEQLANQQAVEYPTPPATDSLREKVQSFGPGGAQSRPSGPFVTDGFFASAD